MQIRSDLFHFAAQFAVKLAGFLAIGLGGAFTFGGQQTLGDNLTPFPVPKDDGELVTDGAYSYTRHPMYTGDAAPTAARTKVLEGVPPKLAFLAISGGCLDPLASVAMICRLPSSSR